MSIFTDVLTGGSNSHQTTSEAANSLATDFVAEGVVGAITNTAGVAPATGGLAVNAQSPAAMAVDVSAGVAYVTATPTSQNSQTLRVKNTATAAATIAANSTGSTRYDWIYLSVSATNAANPNSAGSNATTIVVSRSTSSSSDDGTPPTYGYALAVVTVSNGASSISNGNIADVRSQTSPSDAGSTAWQAYTPTYTNLTVGNGTHQSYFKQIGKTVVARIGFTLGSTSSMGTAPTFSLPVTSNSNYTDGQWIGALRAVVGGAGYPSYVQWHTTTTAYLLTPNSSGAYITDTSGNWSAVIPGNWTTGNTFHGTIVYEAA